jgi:hypothetical protein
VADLLDSLRRAGGREQAAALTDRLSAAGMFRLFLEQKGLADQFRFGREADGAPAAPWSWEDLDLWLVLPAADRRHRRSTERGTHVESASQATATETEEMTRTTASPTVQVDSSKPS